MYECLCMVSLPSSCFLTCTFYIWVVLDVYTGTCFLLYYNISSCVCWFFIGILTWAFLIYMLLDYLHFTKWIYFPPFSAQRKVLLRETGKSKRLPVQFYSNCFCVKRRWIIAVPRCISIEKLMWSWSGTFEEGKNFPYLYRIPTLDITQCNCWWKNPVLGFPCWFPCWILFLVQI